MVVPGYVAQVHSEFTRPGELLMPCHEYCGLGPTEMWANVQVLPAVDFKPDHDGRVVRSWHRRDVARQDSQFPLTDLKLMWLP